MIDMFTFSYNAFLRHLKAHGAVILEECGDCIIWNNPSGSVTFFDYFDWQTKLFVGRDRRYNR